MRPFDKATQFLTGLLSDPDCLRRGRLPTIERCAALAGVSKNTMSRAAARLRDKGLLRPQTKRGLLIVSGCEDRVPQPRPSGPIFSPGPVAAWERVKTQILGDITRGVYPPRSPLPGFKELRRRYAAGPLTLRKAIAALVNDAGLSPHGRGYAVPAGGELRRGRAAVVLLYPRFGSIYRGDTFPAPRLEAIARYLEKRGSEANFELLPIVYAGPTPEGDYQKTGLQDLKLDGKARDCTILGYVFWHMIEYEFERSAIDWLRHSGAPAAIVDDVGDFPFEFLGGSESLVKLFRTASSHRAARRMGQYLVRIGHTHAAFISLYHNLSWSRIRYAALESVFHGADSRNRVSLFPSEPPNGPDSEQRLEEAFATFKRFSGAAGVQYRLNYVKDILPAPLSRLANRLYTGLMPVAEDLSVGILNQAFEQALTDASITVWICANDEIALYALKYLRRRDVDVPGRVSVVGFDDIPAAFADDLTTCSFDVETSAALALDHILRPPLPQPKKPPAMHEAEGRIVERKSCARAASAQSEGASRLSEE